MGQIPQKNQSDSECGGVARHLDAEQPFLRAVVRRVIPRPDAAADVVQRINLAIWKKRSAFETGTSFRSWALAFVRYELLAYRRTLARSREVMLSLEAEELWFHGRPVAPLATWRISSRHFASAWTYFGRSSCSCYGRDMNEQNPLRNLLYGWGGRLVGCGSPSTGCENL